MRQDSQTAKGWAQQDNPFTKTWDPSTRQTVNYKLSHTSYSLGGNYQLNKNLALFARASDGVAFSADRLLYGTALNGSVPVATNTVRQIEGGAKLRAGAFSLFATAFNAKTKESNYEATTRKFTSNDYCQRWCKTASIRR